MSRKYVLNIVSYTMFRTNIVFKNKYIVITYNLKVYIFNFLNIFQGCIIGAGSASSNRGQRSRPNGKELT